MVSISVLVGKRIKTIRESQHIKQVELANMIDIEPTNLSKIEKGIHFPKDETINKIVNALNIETKDLFCFEHLQERDELLKNIFQILKASKTEDLQFFYRVLVAYKEVKCK